MAGAIEASLDDFRPRKADRHAAARARREHKQRARSAGDRGLAQRITADMVAEVPRLRGRLHVPRRAQGHREWATTRRRYWVRVGWRVAAMSDNLVEVLRAVDGQRSIGELAEELTTRLSRTVHPAEIIYLLRTRLVPARMVALDLAPRAPAPSARATSSGAQGPLEIGAPRDLALPVGPAAAVRSPLGAALANTDAQAPRDTQFVAALAPPIAPSAMPAATSRAASAPVAAVAPVSRIAPPLPPLTAFPHTRAEATLPPPPRRPGDDDTKVAHSRATSDTCPAAEVSAAARADGRVARAVVDGLDAADATDGYDEDDAIGVAGALGPLAGAPGRPWLAGGATTGGRLAGLTGARVAAAAAGPFVISRDAKSAVDVAPDAGASVHSNGRAGVRSEVTSPTAREVTTAPVAPEPIVMAPLVAPPTRPLPALETVSLATQTHGMPAPAQDLPSAAVAMPSHPSPPAEGRESGARAHVPAAAHASAAAHAPAIVPRAEPRAIAAASGEIRHTGALVVGVPTPRPAPRQLLAAAVRERVSQARRAAGSAAALVAFALVLGAALGLLFHLSQSGAAAPTGSTPPSLSAARVPAERILPGETAYIVRRGDKLAAIAARYHVSPAALALVNADILGTKAALVPGTRLAIPAIYHPGANPATAPRPLYYVVRPGDTLSAIGARFGVDWSAIAQYNHLADPQALAVGQGLIIPASAAPKR